MGRIAEETISKVADASDIVDVIGSYFKLTRAGSTYKALCPFHQEKTPSFNVSPQRQTYHCFGCGAGGGVIRFVMEYEHVDFSTAVRRLAERAGIPVIEEAGSEEDKRTHSQRKRLLALHQQVAAWFATNLMRSKDAGQARAYLTQRGLGSDVAKAWKLGWAPDSWDACKKWGKAAGFSEEEMLIAGLLTRKEGETGKGGAYDRFRGRVMFPICNDLGEVLAFSGRTLEADPKAAKYVNSPETPIFSKGRVLFGLHHSKRALLASKQAIVCEGQIDVIRVFESGFQNVIAPQGTAFTPHQAGMLKRYVESVVLCFDSDAAGLAAAERSHVALVRADLDVRVVVLPPGEDPDSLIRTQGAEAFRKMLDAASDFYSFLIDRGKADTPHDSPRARAKLAARVAPALSMIDNPILLDSTLASVATKIGVGIPELRRLADVSRQNRQREDFREQDRQFPDLVTSVAQQPAPSIHPALAQVLVICMQHPKSRQWLQRIGLPHELEEIEGVHLLRRLLDFRFSEDSGSISAHFLSSLPSDDESVMSAILQGTIPDDPASLPDCLRALVQVGGRKQIDTLKAKLSESGLSLRHVTQIQKEILDTQRRITEIARLFAEEQSTG